MSLSHCGCHNDPCCFWQYLDPARLSSKAHPLIVSSIIDIVLYWWWAGEKILITGKGTTMASCSASQLESGETSFTRSYGPKWFSSCTRDCGGTWAAVFRYSVTVPPAIIGCIESRPCHLIYRFQGHAFNRNRVMALWRIVDYTVILALYTPMRIFLIGNHAVGGSTA